MISLNCFGEPHISGDLLEVDLDNDSSVCTKEFAQEYDKEHGDNSFQDLIESDSFRQSIEQSGKSRNETKYNEMSSLSNDVKKFDEALQELIKRKSVKVKILTANKKGVKDNFFNPLSKRDDYSWINNVPNIRDYKLHQIEWAKKNVLTNAKNNRINNKDFELRTHGSIPIQLLIAGIKDRPEREGCLVFMVGTETIENIESGQEFGFYTELDTVINIYKNLAEALMKGATPIKDWEDYEEKNQE